MGLESHMAVPPRGYFWGVTHSPASGESGEFELTLYKRKWLVWRSVVTRIRGRRHGNLMDEAARVIRRLKSGY